MRLLKRDTGLGSKILHSCFTWETNVLAWKTGLNGCYAWWNRSSSFQLNLAHVLPSLMSRIHCAHMLAFPYLEKSQNLEFLEHHVAYLNPEFLLLVTCFPGMGYASQLFCEQAGVIMSPSRRTCCPSVVCVMFSKTGLLTKSSKERLAGAPSSLLPPKEEHNSSGFVVGKAESQVPYLKSPFFLVSGHATSLLFRAGEGRFQNRILFKEPF